MYTVSYVKQIFETVYWISLFLSEKTNSMISLYDIRESLLSNPHIGLLNDSRQESIAKSRYD